MASAEDYANWIVNNADKKGTPEFDTVAKAYQLARSQPSETPATETPKAGFKPELGDLSGMPDMTRRTFRAPSGAALRDVAAKAGGAGEMYSQLADAAGRAIARAPGAAYDLAATISNYSPSTLLGVTPRIEPKGVATTDEMLGLKQTPAAYAPYEFTASMLAPDVYAKGLETAYNLGARGVNAAQRLANPVLNALAEASGAKGPDIVNALRASTSGVEGAGQAAAPAGSASFSQFTKELEKHVPDAVAEAARTQDALLAARSNMAEGRMAEGSRNLADAVAAPNKQDVGQNLIDIANKEKRAMKDTVINPAFRKAETLAGDTPIDISNVTRRAADIMDTVDPSVATALSARLRKFQGETKSVENIGPGGARYTTETKIPPSATLAEVGDIRSAINSAAARAKATGDEVAFRDLINLHKELDNAIMSSADLAPEAAAAYKDALTKYATEYAPRFKTGLQFDLFKVRQGENAIKPENVVDKFMNKPTNTDQFIALYGGNPDAMQSAKVGIEGMFRDAAVKDGVIDTAAANKFLDKYSAQIDKLDAKGLGIRDKLTSLVDETSRVTAPESRIAEVRKSVGSSELPEGAASAVAKQRVDALVKNTSAEDLTALRDAVEIARRRGAYNALASTATKEKTGVPVVSSKAPDFLNLPLRITTEVYRRVAGKLNTKMSQELGAMLSDPARLDETANMIEKALAMKARQQGRILKNTGAPPAASAIPALNALAPPNQNSLAGQ